MPPLRRAVSANRDGDEGDDAEATQLDAERLEEMESGGVVSNAEVRGLYVISVCTQC